MNVLAPLRKAFRGWAGLALYSLLSSLLSGFLLGSPAAAAEANTAPQLVREMAGVQEYALPNGLQVLLAPNALHLRQLGGEGGQRARRSG
jgi:hypothetical protein